MATRVLQASSAQNVSGTMRYKYFKRPIMPKISVVQPQVLLAPTANENPLIASNSEVETLTKDAEVQTMYRESEAQTAPYTPEYVVAKGENPEVLLLKTLTYENGLPLGKKEIEMIEYARAKREMEINLPPFTDEASLLLRKKLMEHQEMREFHLREAEIDIRREAKLVELKQALEDREESNEFMTSQRLESVRLLRMEEREKVLQKIRNKRIKSLRRIAHQRNISDPVLSGGTGRDIINDYFDKGSAVYAPVQREGKEIARPSENFSVASRTVPLDNIGNILSLEYTISKRYLDHSSGVREDDGSPTHLSKTAPAGAFSSTRPKGGGGRAAEARLTSAAARSIRNTKRDVEEMHQILQMRKHQVVMNPPSSRPGTSPSARGEFSRVPTPSGHNGGGQGAPRKTIKGRPTTPDFTQMRSVNDAAIAAGGETEHNEFEPSPLADDEAFQSAMILLQRLVRGRAVQNIMFEGKYRRAELIAELKMADEAHSLHHDDVAKVDVQLQIEREAGIRTTTIDAVAGGAASQLLQVLAQEKV
jgi:hypothetical protein